MSIKGPWPDPSTPTGRSLAYSEEYPNVAYVTREQVIAIEREVRAIRAKEAYDAGYLAGFEDGLARAPEAELPRLGSEAP